MITIKDLADELEHSMDSLSDSVNDSVKNDFIGTNFKFHLSVETAEYKPPHVSEDNPNEVTEYICGVMRALPGATNTGYSTDDYIGSLPVSIEFVIPHCEVTDPTTGEPKLLKSVLESFNKYFSDNKSITLYRYEINYIVTAVFSPLYVSAREIRPEVGDSVVVTMQVLYAIVANGLSPKNAQIAVSDENLPVDASGWEKIYTTQLNLARATLTDGNIFNGGNGDTKCTYTGSRLVITVNGAVRGSYLDTAMLKYIVTGDVPIFYVKLTLKGDSKVYKMTFLECEVAIQVPSIPGCAYSLVEVV